MVEQSHRNAPDPYRFLFPLGWSLGIWGAVVWILGTVKSATEQAAAQHPDLMVGGFLFSFVCGFLMTAVPRFTGTRFATRGEIGVQGALLVGVAVSGFLGKFPLLHIWLFLAVVMLLAFVARRFQARTANPPQTFVFIGLGLFCGLAGTLLLLMQDADLIGGPWSLLGRLLYRQGLIVSLVVGVGGRLIPALLGLTPMPTPVPVGDVPIRQYVRQLPRVLPVCMGLLLLSFPLESWRQIALGRWLRAAVVGFIAYRFWGIHRYPRAATRLAFWLWISAWMTVLGLFAYAASPTHAIDFLHITFIGGFGLMTIVVATRVTIAHGGFPAVKWEDSPALSVTGILVMLAVLNRLMIAWLPAAYETYLLLASSSWIVALFVWGWSFVGKMIVIPPRAELPGPG
jgi:uncharacterized protein involved in response to NO